MTSRVRWLWSEKPCTAAISASGRRPQRPPPKVRGRPLESDHARQLFRRQPDVFTERPDHMAVAPPRLRNEVTDPDGAPARGDITAHPRYPFGHQIGPVQTLQQRRLDHSEPLAPRPCRSKPV